MRPTAYINARLVDPASGYDGPGGLIHQGASVLAAGASLYRLEGFEGEVVDCGGRVLAPGLIDLRVKTGEPGAEHIETLETAGHAAVAGGVTTFVIQPDTQPVLDDVALLSYVLRRALATSPAKVLASAALTQGLKGTHMSEIGLLQAAGAVLFSNGAHAIANAKIMRRALVYAKSFGALVSSRCEDASLADGTVMHAGPFAGGLGLRGVGPEAEWLAAQRDLLLAEVTGARLLVDLASTPRTLDLVTAAQKRGARAHVSVSMLNLYFNTLDVSDYLTYCKVSPPFRPEEDRVAMVAALSERRIDVIVSAHDPQPPETKRLPIGEAAFGAIGVETMLAAGLSLVHSEAVSMIDLLFPMTVGPARLLGLPQGHLAAGAPADIVIFDPGAPWLCTRETLRSRSQNSPWDGKRLQGKVWRTLTDGKIVYEA